MDKLAQFTKVWLCNGKACPAGTVHCAVQDPESWPDGCRHTQKREYAAHPDAPNSFMPYYSNGKIYLVEGEDK